MNIEQALTRLSKIDEQLAGGKITRSEHQRERVTILTDLVIATRDNQ